MPKLALISASENIDTMFPAVYGIPKNLEVFPWKKSIYTIYLSEFVLRFKHLFPGKTVENFIRVRLF